MQTEHNIQKMIEPFLTQLLINWRGYLFFFWIFLFFVIGIIGLFEISWAEQFNLLYFRTGIPLYIMRFSDYGGQTELLPGEVLKRYFNEYNFKLLNSHECAFYKIVKGRNLILMHGIIRLSHERDYIIVKGYANWLPILIILWFVGFFLILRGDWSISLSISLFYKSPFLLVGSLIYGLTFINEVMTFHLIGKITTDRY